MFVFCLRLCPCFIFHIKFLDILWFIFPIKSNIIHMCNYVYMHKTFINTRIHLYMYVYDIFLIHSSHDEQVQIPLSPTLNTVLILTCSNLHLLLYKTNNIIKYNWIVICISISLQNGIQYFVFNALIKWFSKCIIKPIGIMSLPEVC